MKRRCRYCKEKVEELSRSVPQVCKKTKCISEFYEENKEKVHAKAKSDLKRQRAVHLKKEKESLKTHSEWLKDLQKAFNAFIRKRDEGKPCISCGSMTGKRDAGHYRSVGSTPELRFEEFNCFSQCVHCNQHLHGNLINYRINLIERIGKEKVEWLEKSHEPKKLSIPEIKELIEEYKNKLKLFHDVN